MPLLAAGEWAAVFGYIDIRVCVVGWCVRCLNVGYGVDGPGGVGGCLPQFPFFAAYSLPLLSGRFRSKWRPPSDKEAVAPRPRGPPPHLDTHAAVARRLPAPRSSSFFFFTLVILVVQSHGN